MRWRQEEEGRDGKRPGWETMRGTKRLSYFDLKGSSLNPLAKNPP